MAPAFSVWDLSDLSQIIWWKDGFFITSEVLTSRCCPMMQKPFESHRDKGRATIGNSVDGSREKFGPNPSKSLEEKSIPKKIQQGLLYCCTKWIQNEPKKKMAKRPDWYCRCCQCSPVFVEIIIQPVLYAQGGITPLRVRTTDALISNHIQSPPDFVFQDLPWSFKKRPDPIWFFFFPTAPEIGIRKNHHENRPGAVASQLSSGCRYNDVWMRLRNAPNNFKPRCFWGQWFCCKTFCSVFVMKKKNQVLKVFSKLRDWHSETPGHDEVQLCLRCIKLDAWPIHS